MDIIEQAKEYGTECHRTTNHFYGGEPYELHLQMVYDAAMKFIHLIPEDDRPNVLAACWVHDVIEDCRQSYNDVKKCTNETVAEIAFALTNEKGKSRHERANFKYYRGIRDTPHAAYVKICDRIANYFYSIKNNEELAAMYEKEMDEFKKNLFDPKYQEMFDYLLTKGNTEKKN